MTEHQDPAEVSRHLAASGSAEERARWDAHLAECAECRRELIEVSRTLASVPARRRLPLAPLAAVAAGILLVVFSVLDRRPASLTRDQEGTLATASAPRPMAPLGDVARPTGLLWHAVPGASRYRVTLFTGEGEVAWQSLGSDTAVTLPDSVALPVGIAQYWQVKAETSYGRWVESELVPFTIRQDSAR